MDSFYVIDRFTDNNSAVLESEPGAWEIPRAWLPDNAREGDVIRIENIRKEDGTWVRFTVDSGATAERRAKLAEKRNRLRRGPKGDFSL